MFWGTACARELILIHACVRVVIHARMCVGGGVVPGGGHGLSDYEKCLFSQEIGKNDVSTSCVVKSILDLFGRARRAIIENGGCGRGRESLCFRVCGIRGVGT